jgi:predicted O-linked N-acetylglucosamine transferase (SPINDLY family)
MNWQKTAQAYLEKGEYVTAVNLLEQSVEVDPADVENYFTLGVAYLLLGEEEEAQATWLCGMAQVEETDIPQWTSHLIELLETEAQRQNQREQTQISWLLRQHVRELAPNDINNLLQLLLLELQLGQFSPDLLKEWGIIEKLQQSSKDEIDLELLIVALEESLNIPLDEVIDFAKTCEPLIESKQTLIDILFRAAYTDQSKNKGNPFGTNLLEIVLSINPKEREVLGRLWRYYSKSELWEKALESAAKYLDLSQTLEERFVGICILLDSHLKGGKWLELWPIAKQQKKILKELIENDSPTINLITVRSLAANLWPFLYTQDNLILNRNLQNQASKIVYKTIQKNFTCGQAKKRSIDLSLNRRLKVGFLTYTFREHSVGWLSRWVFQYLNRTDFHYSIYLYNMEPSNAFFQEWFAPHVDLVRTCQENIEATSDMIAADEVDILIDLDSLTLDLSCCVLALKPAPIQATWLGWDATGLPSIDYFIADPYVLSEHAQQHYQEKILRLPSTYIAVDGFEADVPSIRRSDFNIPNNAIVYFSSQRAMKQHPDVIQAQMQIIKQVPNSYLLIKAGPDISINENYFIYMAEKVGISLDQIRFLGRTPNEFIHRANLRIADVILDTFPYNGATTTLEALWMGLPLVTKVGEQFTARYSYAFLKNVGVEEGIAYTDDEYIEWGVRLGKDEKLRQQVAWKLRQSRHTSPLWNTKQFAHDMENAFRQMWQTYVETAAS